MSKFVEWGDQLSVGIEEIDEQHQVMADLVNKMHEAIQQRHDHDRVRDTLNHLASYTKTHFQAEEKLMRTLKFPDYEIHKAQHDTLVAQMKELQGKLEAGKASVNFELMHFLKVWLTKHIMESDQAYSSHFLNADAKHPRLQKKSWVSKLWGSLHH